MEQIYFYHFELNILIKVKFVKWLKKTKEFMNSINQQKYTYHLYPFLESLSDLLELRFTSNLTLVEILIQIQSWLGKLLATLIRTLFSHNIISRVRRKTVLFTGFILILDKVVIFGEGLTFLSDLDLNLLETIIIHVSLFGILLVTVGFSSVVFELH